MRKQFIKDRDLLPAWERNHAITAMTVEEVLDLCPWQAVISEVEGGWMVFESLDDYEVWISQN